MWQENTTPEEQFINAQRIAAMHALLDPNQPGFTEEERTILRHLSHVLTDAENDSLDYAVLAMEFGCDRSTVSRKVTRLCSRLLARWGLRVPRKEQPPRKPRPTQKNDDHESSTLAKASKTKRSPRRVLDALLERVAAPHRVGSWDGAA